MVGTLPHAAGMTTFEEAQRTTDEPAVHPGPILEIAFGFMAAKHLFAASELGLFEALAEGPTDLSGLAARTGLTPRAARISADAMVALGLLERTGDEYANTPLSGTFLSGATPADLRPLLRFWDKISLPAWLDLAGTLGRGPSRQIFDLDESLQPIASAGIEAFQAGPAAALPRTVPLDGCRVLDVGGGTGSWSIALARHFPNLTATVLELPSVAPIARDRIAADGLGDRVGVLEGDAMTDPVPKGYDTFLLANLVHYWSPDQNRGLLRRLREAAGPGTTLVLVDFWTDATHTRPFEAALMAGEFASHLENGDVYSVDEAREWLADTGWRFTEHRPLVGPMSLVLGRTH